MADDKLVSYILRSRENGRTDEQIMRSLLSVGWQKEKVEEAFYKANFQTKEAAQGQAQAPSETKELQFQALKQPSIPQAAQPATQESVWATDAPVQAQPSSQQAPQAPTQEQAQEKPISLEQQKPIHPLVSDVIKAIRSLNFNWQMLVGAAILVFLIIGAYLFIIPKISFFEGGRITKPYQKPDIDMSQIEPPPPIELPAGQNSSLSTPQENGEGAATEGA